MEIQPCRKRLKEAVQARHNVHHNRVNSTEPRKHQLSPAVKIFLDIWLSALVCLLLGAPAPLTLVLRSPPREYSLSVVLVVSRRVRAFLIAHSLLVLFQGLPAKTLFPDRRRRAPVSGRETQTRGGGAYLFKAGRTAPLPHTAECLSGHALLSLFFTRRTGGVGQDFLFLGWRRAAQLRCGSVENLLVAIVELLDPTVCGGQNEDTHTYGCSLKGNCISAAPSLLLQLGSAFQPDVRDVIQTERRARVALYSADSALCGPS
ncbi:hypothetical protein NDU88_006735 [Pleurodeles waltl]|uniref:Uncharacterized protein n=1 Tax=Pleurodeles waltl TaxID=8319 RepID=A0AAV7NSR5_PLEWA|nr:hypothetical protein NDU88_006735 [Pleurodeles waltl]